jgi:DNA-binding NtrC family response regulator
MIRIWHSPEVDSMALCQALAEGGVEAAVASLVTAGDEGGSVTLQAAVVASSRFDPVGLGDAVHRVARRLKPGTPLLVCCPPIPRADRDLLRDYGCTALVSPRAWSPRALAERLLGELIASGEVLPSRLGSLLGGAAPMQRLYQRIERLAPLNEPVLILGETGTGKELVATELHARSGRRGELVSINAAALSTELVESELFGHERGAFTGATEKRKGLLVHAGAGTVFLDEIGDLAASAQAKLLRVLEERKVRPVGSNETVPVAARLVFATHRDLEAACTAGTFREDLFERLRGLAIEIPPLRDRREDLPLLTRHFLELWDSEYRAEHSFPEGSVDLLFPHSWPGNVRELRHVVAQMASEHEDAISPLRLSEVLQLRRRRAARPEHGGFRFDPSHDTWQKVHERLKAEYFRSLLEFTRGRREEAIRLSGLGRSRFFEVLKELKLGERDEGPSE